jgi:hypothetical protein
MTKGDAAKPHLQNGTIHSNTTYPSTKPKGEILEISL